VLVEALFLFSSFMLFSRDRRGKLREKVPSSPFCPSFVFVSVYARLFVVPACSSSRWSTLEYSGDIVFFLFFPAPPRGDGLFGFPTRQAGGRVSFFSFEEPGGRFFLDDFYNFAQRGARTAFSFFLSGEGAHIAFLPHHLSLWASARTFD